MLSSAPPLSYVCMSIQGGDTRKHSALPGFVKQQDRIKWETISYSDVLFNVYDKEAAAVNKEKMKSGMNPQSSILIPHS